MQRKARTSSEKLMRRRKAWLKKLANVGPVVRGSLVTAQRGNHQAHQLTTSVKGKTHTVYVPVDMLKEVTSWIKNYRRMQRIVKEISKLNMALIHRHLPENPAADRRRAPRRPQP